MRIKEKSLNTKETLYGFRIVGYVITNKWSLFKGCESCSRKSEGVEVAKREDGNREWEYYQAKGGFKEFMWVVSTCLFFERRVSTSINIIAVYIVVYFDCLQLIRTNR